MNVDRWPEDQALGHSNISRMEKWEVSYPAKETEIRQWCPRSQPKSLCQDPGSDHLCRVLLTDQVTCGLRLDHWLWMQSSWVARGDGIHQANRGLALSRSVDTSSTLTGGRWSWGHRAGSLVNAVLTTTCKCSDSVVSIFSIVFLHIL